MENTKIEEPFLQLGLHRPHKPSNGKNKNFPIRFSQESWGRFIREFSRYFDRFEFQIEDYMGYYIDKLKKLDVKMTKLDKRAFIIGGPKLLGFANIIKIEGKVTPKILKMLGDDGLKSIELKIFSKDKLIAEIYDHGDVAYLYS